MADQNLPDPKPAQDGNTPPAPEPKPADDKPVVPPLQLTDEQKTYLKGQGLTDEDLSSPDAMAKIINHARSSQKAVSEYKDKLDKVSGAINPAPADPANPFAVPPTPATPDQPQPNPNPQPAPNSGGGIDPATAFLLTNQLATSFPLLKDDLVSGKLYTDMQAIGIPMKTADGQINLQGLTTYAKMQQDARETAAKLAELSKPGEGAIPDANATTPQQPASDAPMTAQMARAILLQDRNHPRAAEATKFLQTNIGKK